MVSVIAEYRTMGRIAEVGMSQVSIEQIQLAEAVVPIAAVTNELNLGARDDETVDYCAERGIRFVPFFPLRGGDREAIETVAGELGATPQQVRLAWLLKRSPAMVPIPGTLDIDHLRENLGALDVELSDEQFERLAR